MSGDICEITDLESLDEIRKEWNQLLDKVEHSNIFMTWEWYYRWWESFSDEDRLRILCVREAGELLGVLPLRKKDDVLKFVGDNNVCPDHLDIVVRQKHAARVSDLTLSYILREKCWRRLELNALRPDSFLEAAFDRLDTPPPAGCRISIVHGSPSPYIDLPDSWSDYLGTMKAEYRRRQIRYLEKLTARYGEKFYVGQVGERSEVVEIMAELKRLHTLRWAARNIESVFSDERFYRFHLHIALDFLVRGWLSLFYVKIGDEVVGVLYCFKYRQCMYFYQHGHDPGFSSYALGRVMIGHAIRNSIESGLEVFDFLRGGEKYKYFWTRKERIDRNARIDRA